MRHCLAFIIAVVTCLSSCTKEIVMDVDEEPIVIIECLLTEEPEQFLRLTMAGGASLDAAPLIGEATAVLIDMGSKQEVGHFKMREDGIWAMQYAAVPNHSYRLEVRVPGHDLIWAEQEMPERCPIHTEYALDDSYNPSVVFTGDILDNSDVKPDKDAFYSPSNEEIGRVTLIFLDSCPHSLWLSAFNYNPETGRREIAEYICTDSEYADNFNVCGIYEPPTSTAVEMITYINDDPFSSNIYKRVPGRTYLTELYANLRGFPLHKRYLMLDAGSASQEELRNNPVIVSGSFTGDYYGNYKDYRHLSPDTGTTVDEIDEDLGILVASIMSGDYDKYLRDAIYAQTVSDSGNLSSIYLTENIHSNINGGLGIFGAKVDIVLRWSPAYMVKADSSGKPIVIP